VNYSRMHEIVSVSYFERGLNNRYTIEVELYEDQDHVPHYAGHVSQLDQVLFSTKIHDDEEQAIGWAVRWIVRNVDERRILIHNDVVYDCTYTADEDGLHGTVMDGKLDQVLYYTPRHGSLQAMWDDLERWVRNQ
jgi:hypothetical protein